MYHGFVQINDYFMVIGGYDNVSSFDYNYWEYPNVIPTSEPTSEPTAAPEDDASNDEEMNEWYQDISKPDDRHLIFGTVFGVRIGIFCVVYSTKKDVSRCTPGGEYGGLLK